MKKLICLAICIGMIFGLMACGGKDGSQTIKEEVQSGDSQKTADKSQETKSEEPVKQKDPLEFTVVADLLAWTKANLDVNESEELKAWMELSNTRISYTTPPHANYGEKINLLMASGDMPDVIMGGSWQDYAEQGQLVELNEYYDTEAGKAMKEKWYSGESLLYCSIGDTIYGIPNKKVLYASEGTMVRKDWLDKLGLKKPETLEEYREVLKAFTYNDPDGNGKDDTYGYTLRSNFTYMNTFLGAFAIDSHHGITYDLVDGKLVPQQTQDKYKEYLKYMRSLFYEDKVVVPNGMVNTSDQWKEDMFTGKAGMWFHSTTRIDQYFMHNMMLSNPDWEEKGIELDFLVPPLDPTDGKGGQRNGADVAEAIFITTAAKDPKAIFDYFMWAFTAPEALDFVKFGLEGKHHVVENGKKVWKEGVLQDESQWQIKEMVHLSKYLPIDDEEVEATYGERALLAFEHNLKYNKPPSTLFIGKPVLEVENEYPDINSIILEYTMKIVMGDMELESGYDDMVKKLEGNGLNEITAARQQWYDENRK